MLATYGMKICLWAVPIIILVIILLYNFEILFFPMIYIVLSIEARMVASISFDVLDFMSKHGMNGWR